MIAPNRITHHAVERYRQRYEPGSSFPDAEADLQRHVRDAEYQERTVDGDDVWVSPAGVRMVVRADGTVVTVLPPLLPCGRRRGKGAR